MNRILIRMKDWNNNFLKTLMKYTNIVDKDSIASSLFSVDDKYTAEFAFTDYIFGESRNFETPEIQKLIKMYLEKFLKFKFLDVNTKENLEGIIKKPILDINSLRYFFRTFFRQYNISGYETGKLYFFQKHTDKSCDIHNFLCTSRLPWNEFDKILDKNTIEKLKTRLIENCGLDETIINNIDNPDKIIKICNHIKKTHKEKFQDEEIGSLPITRIIKDALYIPESGLDITELLSTRLANTPSNEKIDIRTLLERNPETGKFLKGDSDQVELRADDDKKDYTNYPDYEQDLDYFKNYRHCRNYIRTTQVNTLVDKYGLTDALRGMKKDQKCRYLADNVFITPIVSSRRSTTTLSRRPVNTTPQAQTTACPPMKPVWFVDRCYSNCQPGYGRNAMTRRCRKNPQTLSRVPNLFEQTPSVPTQLQSIAPHEISPEEFEKDKQDFVKYSCDVDGNLLKLSQLVQKYGLSTDVKTKADICELLSNKFNRFDFKSLTIDTSIPTPPYDIEKDYTRIIPPRRFDYNIVSPRPTIQTTLELPPKFPLGKIDVAPLPPKSPLGKIEVAPLPPKSPLGKIEVAPLPPKSPLGEIEVAPKTSVVSVGTGGKLSEISLNPDKNTGKYYMPYEAKMAMMSKSDIDKTSPKSSPSVVSTVEPIVKGQGGMDLLSLMSIDEVVGDGGDDDYEEEYDEEEYDDYNGMF